MFSFVFPNRTQVLSLRTGARADEYFGKSGVWYAMCSVGESSRAASHLFGPPFLSPGTDPPMSLSLRFSRLRIPIRFARAAAVALVAIGCFACLSSDAFAATRNWTGTASGTAARQWGTSTAAAANWSPATNPTSNDWGIFSSNSNQTVIAVSGNTLPIGNLVFRGSGTTNFSMNTGASIVIYGTGSPSVGISSTSGRQNFSGSGSVVVNASQMTFISSAGGLTFSGGGLDLNGNYLKVEGTTRATIGSSVAGATYEVVSGVQDLFFDGDTGMNVSSLVINGGETTGDGTSSTDLTVSGGTWNGGGTFDAVTSSSGLVDLTGVFALNVTSYVQSATGATRGDVLSDLTSSLVSGNFELGGAYQLNAFGLGSDLFPIGTMWSLFSGVNYKNGSPAALNDASNFSSFALTADSSTSPYYGVFTNSGQEWSSPSASDESYLVFQAATGNLVVVPEPSTCAMALAGVACGGYLVRRRRRA